MWCFSTNVHSFISAVLLCFCPPGSDGNLYKRASSDVFYDDDSDGKPVLETRESRMNVPRLQTPHAPITSSQSQEATAPVKPSPSAKQDDRLQLRVTSCLAAQGAGSHIAVPSKTFGAEQHADWPTEKWQIWQLLSSDSIDTLPETMVWRDSSDVGHLINTETFLLRRKKVISVWIEEMMTDWSLFYCELSL